MKSARFFTLLISKNKWLRHLKPKEMAVFNVSGNYGNYQVKIGPEDIKNHTRPVEINGHIHHLFVTKESGLSPYPPKEEIDHNLKGTIIMNDVTVHLFDERGEGQAVRIERPAIDGVHARSSINLAGESGDEMMKTLEASGKLSNEAYQIVQMDILKSLNRS